MQHYFTQVTSTAAVATATPPPYRDSLNSFLNPSEINMVKNAAKDVLIKFDQQEVTSTAAVATATPPPSETMGKKRKRTTEDELRTAMLEKMTGGKPPVEESSQAVNELRTYLGMIITPEEKKKLDVFKWWKVHQEMFPHLSNMAKLYLSIPATSASSERLWSKVGLILSKLRTRLGATKLNQLMFIKSNYRLVFSDVEWDTLEQQLVEEEMNNEDENEDVVEC